MTGTDDLLHQARRAYGRRDGLGTMWGTQTAVRMLHEAGFDRVEAEEIETDPFNRYYPATR